MKILHFPFLIFISLFIIACDGNNIDDDIILGSYDLNFFGGQDTTIIVKSSLKSYTASSNNLDVASVELIDNKIVIKTKEINGTATLVVKEGSNKKTEIRVKTRIFSQNQWTEVHNSVDVKASNINFVENLKNELTEENLLRISSRYNFEVDNKLKLQDIRGNVKEGTFSYKDKYLTLKYDNKNELYSVFPLDATAAYITLDLTERYKKEYPNEGIAKVTITRLMGYLIR